MKFGTTQLKAPTVAVEVAVAVAVAVSVAVAVAVPVAVAVAVAVAMSVDVAEEAMRELRCEQIGDRRVRLMVDQDNRYTVTIEVHGPEGAWEDISLIADRDLALHTASLCYVCA